MGVFDQFNQFKDASKMLKDMDPAQMNQLMQQAGSMQKAMEDTIRKVVAEEIQKRGLVTKEDVQKMVDGLKV